jgi:ATP-dependent DNA ligase
VQDKGDLMRSERENIMLAYAADNGRIERLGPQFFVQPKYRGERMRVEWFHGEPILLSSYGIEFRFFPHIKEELMKLPKLPWDGEAYVHGWSQEQINSVANRTVNKHPDSEKMQFHIFDYQGESSTQLHRVKRLLTTQADYALSDAIQFVPTKIATPDTWQPYLQEWMGDGYEGIIFRKPYAQYVKKRNVCLLKFKPTSEDKYLIIGFEEAIDKYGDAKGTLGSFIVQGDDGTEFKVGAGKLLHSERQRIWNDSESVIGKMLLVKHEDEKTRHGVPVCAVAVEVVK